jgi:hypothetical protein
MACRQVPGVARAALHCTPARTPPSRTPQLWRAPHALTPRPPRRPDPSEQHRQLQLQRQRHARSVPGGGGTLGSTSGGAAPQPEPSRSWSFRVPDSDSDSDEGAGSDGATSGLRGPARPSAATSSGARRHAPGPVHAVHLARTRQLKQQVQESYSAAAGALEHELLQIEADLAEQLQRLAAETGDKQVGPGASYLDGAAWGPAAAWAPAPARWAGTRCEHQTPAFGDLRRSPAAPRPRRPAATPAASAAYRPFPRRPRRRLCGGGGRRSSWRASPRCVPSGRSS